MLSPNLISVFSVNKSPFWGIGWPVLETLAPTETSLKDDNFIITYGYQDNAAYALKMPTKLLDNLNWENRKSWKNNGL